MIDVSEVVNDTDFCYSFTILRSTSSFVPGGISSAQQSISMYGPVQVADAKTLKMVPEGDRVEGARVFWSTVQMYETNQNGISDVIEWYGQTYRIVKVWPWQTNGYWKAYAVRMSGT
jgi:hypothetical protein